MKTLKFCTLTVLLTMFFFSCKKDKTMYFETVKITDSVSSPLAGKSNNAFCKVEVDFTYPARFYNAEVLREVQNALIATVLDSSYINTEVQKIPEIYAQNAFSDYRNFLDDANARGDKSGFVLQYQEEWQLSASVIFYGKNILCYEISENSFDSGAAHEMSHTGYFAFDLNTGRQIRQEDIFTENSLDSISALLRRQIMLDRNFSSEKELAKKLIYADNIAPNNNFMVDDVGISFLFNTYEIADHSDGITIVSLPYSALKPFLKEGNPVMDLLEPQQQ